MRTPRYLLASESFALDRGGIARVGRLLARAFRALDIDHEMLSLHDRRIDDELGQTLLAAGDNRLKFVTSAWLASPRFTDVMFTHAGLARAQRRVPAITPRSTLWMMGIEAWSTHRKDYVRAARRADRLFSISNFTKTQAALVDPTFARARVCWLSTEQDDGPAFEPAQGPPTVLILGRLDAAKPYKGHVDLIRCWPRVLEACPQARLLIAGTGEDEPQLRRLTAETGVVDSVDFLGFVPEADVPALWRRTHVFAMPSRKEGFGLVYIEAMRFGVPVVASVHDAAQEVNADGVTGFNVSLDNGVDLPEKLILLLTNPELRRKMGAAGIERWRTLFRLSAFIDRLHRLLQDDERA